MARSVVSQRPGSGQLADWFDRAAGWAAAHVPALFALFVASRLLLLVARLAALQHSTNWYHYVYNWDYAALSDRGAYPYLNFWMEYPPIFLWLEVGLYRLTAVAGAAHRMLFYGATGAILVLAEVAILFAVYRLGHLVGGRSSAARAALLYVLLSIPVYLYSGWFDTVPTALFLIAAVWLFERRLTGSALLAGVGVMTKLFPALLALLALRYLRRRVDGLRYLAILAATVAVIALPFLVIAPRYFVASFETTSSQRPWETVWALWDRYYSFATFPDLPAHFNPATATAAAYHTHYSLILAGLIVILPLWLAYTRAPRDLSAYRGIVLLALTLTLALLAYKGYSPQYLIWLLPLLFVALPPATAATFAVLLQIDNLLEYPVYFHWFARRGPDLLILTVCGRAILLVALAVVCYRIVTSRRPDPPLPQAEPAALRA